MSKYFQPRTIAGIFLFAAFLLVALVLLLVLWRPESSSVGESTAIIAVIPAPTSTPSPVPTPIISPTSDSEIPPSPPPDSFGVGAYVQVSGTGGDGLRMRTGPGLDNPVGYLAMESEVFTVIQGPESRDEYTWWLLRSPTDDGEQRQGWAVSNYLIPIQTP